MNKEMNKKVSRRLGVAFITAAICCGSAVVGMAEVVRNPASDAKTPSATAATSAEEVVPKQIISSITEWLKPYQVRRNPFSVAKNGKEFRIEGMIAGCCLPFSKYDMVIRLDAERKEAYCFGYLPIRIIDTQRARILEFLFRAECEYGLSHTTFVLLDNGTVGCQSWCPFSYLEKCPKDALAYLIRSVMDRLVACSMDICWVLFDPIPDKASKVLAGGWSRRALKLVSCNGNESLAKKCLGDDWPKTPMKVDDWFRKRFINEDDGSFGIMQDSFQNVMKTGPYSELSYVLVAKGEAVHNICQMPVDIPRDRLLKIADAAMRSNQMRSYGHFGVDFEHGKLWCRYSIPVAAFVKDADSFYCSATQYLSPHVLAKHSEKFLAILRQK